VSLLLGAGCGARGFVVEESLIDANGGGVGNGPVSGTGGNGAGGDSPDEPITFEITRLPRCSLGEEWSGTSSRNCNFRFNGRCYDDTTAVCACACPRDRNSACVLRGFLSDPDNPLMVSCQALP
jgi:hypothetical protein